MYRKKTISKDTKAKA
jgi:hypothetical protein